MNSKFWPIVLLAGASAAANAQAGREGDMGALRTGDIVAMYVEKNDARYYLNGMVAGGAVELSNSTNIPPYTGTWWMVISDPDSNQVALNCLAAYSTSFLNGIVASETVNLASSATNDPYTGTKWKVTQVNSNTITLDCAASSSYDHQWLEGSASSGVRLDASDGSAQPEAYWKIVRISALTQSTDPPFPFTVDWINSLPK